MTCNANSKGAYVYNFHDSVTFWERWQEIYLSHILKGPFGAMNNQKVCCVHCKQEHTLRRFNDYHHRSRCVGLWEHCQRELEQKYLYGDSWRRRHTYRHSCHRCNRTIYSERSSDFRTCVVCSIEMNRDAVKRWQAKAQAQRDLRRQCETCENWFQPKRSTAKFCSTKCRVANHRKAGQ